LKQFQKVIFMLLMLTFAPIVVLALMFVLQKQSVRQIEYPNKLIRPIRLFE